MTNFSQADDNEFDINQIDNYNEEKINEFVANNFWKIRDCADYKTENGECTSFRGRFQQYFVKGEFLDCSSWKSRYKNCQKCSSGDKKACAMVICAEDKSRLERFRAHLANDTWKRRESPPSNWNAELPDWYLEKHKDSFLIASDENKTCCIQ